MIGGLAGWFAGLGLGAILGFVVGFGSTYVITTFLVEGTASLIERIHNPLGTPVKRENSYPESLAARGRFEDAINAYQVCCADYPEDPEPYLRIARIYRDHLEQYEEAVFWFKRARSEAETGAGRELLATQEIIEIYTNKLRTPTRAIPELARIVDKFPDDPAAEWARREIERLKERI